MRATDRTTPQFYLATPRLLRRLRGGNAERTERNWIEANILGAAVFVVSYVAMFLLLVPHAAFSKRLLLAVPVAIATWLFWLLALYVDSLEIRLLRALGFMRHLSDARAQSILICLMTTLFASWLATSQTRVACLGVVWLAAVVVNLSAAGILAVLNARR